MGDILEIIKSRRTIRNFLPQFVDWEKVARLIDAARHAPCAGNVQNWRFIVILEPDLKQAIAKACYEQYEIAQAGILIVVCTEDDKIERYYGKRGVDLYSIQSAGAAMQNMLLEAHSLGLGTRWIGAFDDDEIRTLLRIPFEYIRPQAIIAVGYPQEIPPKPVKFPLESLIFFNQWRNRHRDPAKYMQDIAVVIKRRLDAAKHSFEEAKETIAGKFKEKSAEWKEKLKEKR